MALYVFLYASRLVPSPKKALLALVLLFSKRIGISEMSKVMNFELVSPEAKLVSEPVHQIEIPGDDGAFGVMAGHCSILSSLRTGVVTLHKEEGGTDNRRIFINGGFADVSAENCTILAEEAIDVKDLDKENLEQSLSDLNEDLSIAVENHDKKHIEDKIILTKAKLAAVAV